MEHRWEPMGGEVDSDQRVAANWSNDNDLVNNNNSYSVSDSHLDDDLALRVRNLLLNFEEEEEPLIDANKRPLLEGDEQHDPPLQLPSQSTNFDFGISSSSVSTSRVRSNTGRLSLFHDQAAPSDVSNDFSREMRCSGMSNAGPIKSSARRSNDFVIRQNLLFHDQLKSPDNSILESRDKSSPVGMPHNDSARSSTRHAVDLKTKKLLFHGQSMPSVAYSLEPRDKSSSLQHAGSDSAKASRRFDLRTKENFSQSSQLPKISISEEEKKSPHFDTVQDFASYDTFSRALHNKVGQSSSSETTYSLNLCPAEHKPPIKSRLCNKEEKSFIADSRSHLLRPSLQRDSNKRQELLENETERSWSEITVTAESLSHPQDAQNQDKANCSPDQNYLRYPTAKASAVDSSIQRIPSSSNFLHKNSLTRPSIVSIDNTNASVKSRSMPQAAQTLNVPSSSRISVEDWRINLFDPSRNSVRESDRPPFSSPSDLDPIGRETPPLSASSFASSRRLEWDNGADIGYRAVPSMDWPNNVAVLSLKTREIPEMARGDPEGISLLNEAMNVNFRPSSTGFPFLSFQSGISSIKYSQDMSSQASSAAHMDDDFDQASNVEDNFAQSSSVDNFHQTTSFDSDFLLTSNVANSDCHTSDAVEDLLDRSSSPGSLSRSDSKRSVIYNSVRDMFKKAAPKAEKSFSFQSFRNMSCPDLTDLRSSTTRHDWPLSKSEEEVGNRKIRKTSTIKTFLFPGLGDQNTNKYQKRDTTHSSERQSYPSMEEYEGRDVLFAIQGALPDNHMQQTCRTCHTSLSIKGPKMVPHLSHPIFKNTASYSEGDVQAFEFGSGDVIAHPIYDIADAAPHDDNVQWVNEPSDDLAYKVLDDYATSGPVLLVRESSSKLKNGHLPKVMGSFFNETLASDHASSEIKPHIRWYPFAPATSVQDIKDVSTQTSVSFVAQNSSRAVEEQPNNEISQAVYEQQTSDLELVSGRLSFAEINNGMKWSMPDEEQRVSNVEGNLTNQKENLSFLSRNTLESGFLSRVSDSQEREEFLSHPDTPPQSMSQTCHSCHNDLSVNLYDPVLSNAIEILDTELSDSLEHRTGQLGGNILQIKSTPHKERKLGVGEYQTVPKTFYSAPLSSVSELKDNKPRLNVISSSLRGSAFTGSDTGIGKNVPLSEKVPNQPISNVEQLTSVFEQHVATSINEQQHSNNALRRSFAEISTAPRNELQHSVTNTYPQEVLRNKGFGPFNAKKEDLNTRNRFAANSSSLLEFLSRNMPLSDSKHLEHNEGFPKSFSDPLLSGHDQGRGDSDGVQLIDLDSESSSEDLAMKPEHTFKPDHQPSVEEDSLLTSNSPLFFKRQFAGTGSVAVSQSVADLMSTDKFVTDVSRNGNSGSFVHAEIQFGGDPHYQSRQSASVVGDGLFGDDWEGRCVAKFTPNSSMLRKKFPVSNSYEVSSSRKVPQLHTVASIDTSTTDLPGYCQNFLGKSQPEVADKSCGPTSSMVSQSMVNVPAENSSSYVSEASQSMVNAAAQSKSSFVNISHDKVSTITSSTRQPTDMGIKDIYANKVTDRDLQAQASSNHRSLSISPHLESSSKQNELKSKLAGVYMRDNHSYWETDLTPGKINPDSIIMSVPSVPTLDGSSRYSNNSSSRRPQVINESGARSLDGFIKQKGTRPENADTYSSFIEKESNNSQMSAGMTKKLKTDVSHGINQQKYISHGLGNNTHLPNMDSAKRNPLVGNRNFVSVGVQVSGSTDKCSFCRQNKNSHFSHCPQMDKFKDVLSRTLEKGPQHRRTFYGRAGTSYCVFSKVCTCCCNRTLQEAFNIHRAEIVKRIETRQKEVETKTGRNLFLYLAPPAANQPQNTKINLKKVPAKSTTDRLYSNKENIKKTKKSYSTPLNVAKEKSRQKNIIKYNRVMSKIYSQRLKSEILKGKVNFSRHEALMNC